MRIIGPFTPNTYTTYEYEWGEWSKKFAYKPVKIDGRLVWLRTYYERAGTVTERLGGYVGVGDITQKALTLLDVLSK